MGLEYTLLYLKRWGAYQIVTYIMIAVCMNFPSAWQLYGITFEGPSIPMPHDCVVDMEVGIKRDPCKYHPLLLKIDTSKDTIPSLFSNHTQKKNASITYIYDKKVLDCEKFTYSPELVNYEFPKVDGTIQQQFDIVCDKKNWITWSQVIFTGGTLVGAALCPPFGDFLGRRTIFFICQLFMCIFGIAMAFSPNLASVCVFQFLTGAFAMGNDLCGFVIACELFPKDMRSFISPFLYTFFALGTGCLAAWSKAFPKWSDLQLAISLASVVTLAYWPFCPESWRWLLSKGRKKEAEKYLNIAAAYNGLPPIDPDKLHDEEHKDEATLDANQTFINYMKVPKLVMYALSMAFIMGSSNLIYFGLGLMVATLSGDFHTNFAALALVEIIGVVMAVATVSYFGRRIPISCFFFWASVFLFLAVIFNRVKDIGDLTVDQQAKFVTSFVVISKIGVTAAYCVILVYIQEIYPTFMRASGIGLTAGLGNIGTLCAPIAILSSELEFDKFYIPIIIFGSVAFVAGFVTLLIPETLGRQLPSTIEDVKKMTHTLSKKEWVEARRQVLVLLGIRKDLDQPSSPPSEPSTRINPEINGNNTKSFKPDEAPPSYSNGQDNHAFTPEKGSSKISINI